MDDLQIVIYIVFIVLYILSRALRKKKPAVEDDSQSPDSSDRTVSNSENTPRKKPVTFEELLRELEGGTSEEPEVDKEEQYVEPEPVKEPEPEKKYRVYESAIEQPVIKPEWQKYMEEGGIKTLDESVDLDAPLRKRFDKYTISKKENIHTATRYRNLLRDPESIKDAIILREILDRKYF